jgi:CheY-like chemotaxis protein
MIMYLYRMIAVDRYMESQRKKTSTETRPFDVILLDLDMPIMNGFEACRRIRKFDCQDDLS